MRIPVIVLVLVVSIGRGSVAQEDCPFGDYGYGDLTVEAIAARYEPAILRLTSGSHVGTGFVIDADRGLVLTAAHVVLDRSRAPRGPIKARTVAADKPLGLEVVSNLAAEKADLALLRLVDSATLSHVHALDLSIDPPKKSSEVMIFGYPAAQSFEDTEAEPREGRITAGNSVVDFGGSAFRGLVLTSIASRGGFSGSPVVSLDGVVLAVVSKEKQGVTTMATPLVDLAKLFAEGQITYSDSRIDASLRSDDTRPFHRFLQPLGYRTSLRNLDLLEWAWSATGDEARRALIDRFVCRAEDALSDRHLKLAARHLRGTLRAESRANLEISEGYAALLTGESAVAVERLASAQAFFRAELEAAIAETPNDTDRIVVARIGTQQASAGLEQARGRIGLAELQEKSTPEVALPEDEATAWLLQAKADCGAIDETPFFEFNSAELTKPAIAALKRVATAAERCPELDLRLAGFTDATGDPAYNSVLSKRRAEAAGRFLKTSGVDPSRISVVGRGEAATGWMPSIEARVVRVEPHAPRVLGAPGWSAPESSR